jgi:hypothetical protein
MQLRNARLCLDCEEVHDAQQCPACASEMYAPITRWVVAPERRTHSRSEPPSPSASRAEIYRELLNAENRPSRTRRLLKGGVLGVAAIGLLGWFMRTPPPRKSE